MTGEHPQNDPLTIEEFAARHGADPDEVRARLADHDTATERRKSREPDAITDAARGDVERRYRRWCRSTGREPQPLHPDAVALYPNADRSRVGR